MKEDIRHCKEGTLGAWLRDRGQPAFREKQIHEWIWMKGALDFEEMSNLPKSLREALAEDFEIRPITEDKRQVSADGTIKTRFRLYDGHLIESVLIPVVEEQRFTVCVSSQVGCSLSCSFCATGRMDRVRNLAAGEIIDQVRMVSRQSEEYFGHPITNIVYMGMGEPLLAYRPVMDSVDIISSDKGLGMSPRRITVSTAGIAKMIRKMADDETRVNLALSLHAADDEKRDRIMPINEHNNLAVLMDAIEYFHQMTKGRISYEYIAFDGFNDSLDDASKLVGLCSRFPVRVNIIEYNPIGGDFAMTKASEERINRFAKYLRDHGVMVTVRRSRGKDIDAACGQLANKS